MEITLTDDQSFFDETTRKFLDDKCSIAAVRSFRHDPAGFDRDVWRQGAELGWMSMLVPEDLGGGSVSGSGVIDLTLVADAFGTHVAPGPLLPCNVVAAALARAASDEHRAELLPALVAGESIGAWVVGPPAQLGIRAGVTATAEGDGYVLSGAEAPVEAGAQADVLLVTSQLGDGGGLAQFVVEPSTAGVSVTPLDSIDLTRRYARVAFDGVRVPASAAVGTPGESDDDVERQLQLALVILAAENVGAAQAAFDLTLEWTFDRYSFGKPLASYQAIKHRMADNKMWLEASHGLASAAAREVQAGAPSAAETASIAKAYQGEYLPALAQDCTQLHGGIGVTYEHDLNLFLRRITVDSVMYGTVSDHRQRVVAFREVAA
ncbi:MAG TPA: acyl-CoA dehydrogenase family protein [Gaiellaceae bacterium]|nr:acyl-CoA dehydrogenase family protein [Gaiellaceae bacterium]